MSPRVTIHMPLLDEGTDAWRAVHAEARGDGTYKVLGPVPMTEQWAFAPGTLVRCRLRMLSGDFGQVSEVLAAEEQVPS